MQTNYQLVTDMGRCITFINTGHSKMMRRQAIVLTAATLSAPFVATSKANEALRWNMVTSWPKNLPGPSVTAQRLADRIIQMSDGRIQIKLYAAGELVPAFEVLYTVSQNTAQIGHTAAFFWQGKIPASVFFTAVPFGLTPDEHAAWIYHGGGQELWEQAYADFDVQPYMAGNTGTGMGGWFKKEINGLDDLKGLKYRMPGLGGEIYRRLGATPVSLAPGEIFGALQSGTLDGAEFVGPASDLAFGFYKIAPYYYWPGFHEPNETGECLVSKKALAMLPDDLRAIVSNACAAENAFALAESKWRNAEALNTLIDKHGVQVRPFPQYVLQAARETAEEVLLEFAKKNEMTRKVYESFNTAKNKLTSWSSLSTKAFLDARGNS
jgi:TRAP-type mannitol/chloroaromatic compound transport system substrate-binding protein